ncbi:hypothetical protein PG993_014094 [Apiospora rasikravindrae]|uniref:Phytase-like domain-containing protein n=1 Tax=Apiospora rasikravindrae TaxID=990691 RepID=A0ABR1RS73_9PEZI
MAGAKGIRTDPTNPSTLFLTNTGQGLFAALPIDPATGTAKGDPTVIASVLYATAMQYDDFAIRRDDGHLATGSRKLHREAQPANRRVVVSPRPPHRGREPKLGRAGRAHRVRLRPHQDRRTRVVCPHRQGSRGPC